MGGDHKCPVCGSTFTRSQHVARHMRSHTGDRPYKCVHCGDQFARSDLLSRHVNKCHTNEKKNPNAPQGAGNARRKGRQPSMSGPIDAPPIIPPNPLFNDVLNPYQHHINAVNDPFSSSRLPSAPLYAQSPVNALHNTARRYSLAQSVEGLDPPSLSSSSLASTSSASASLDSLPHEPVFHVPPTHSYASSQSLSSALHGLTDVNRQWNLPPHPHQPPSQHPVHYNGYTFDDGQSDDPSRGFKQDPVFNSMLPNQPYNDLPTPLAYPSMSYGLSRSAGVDPFIPSNPADVPNAQPQLSHQPPPSFDGQHAQRFVDGQQRGEGGFSSAFGLMSLEDAAVLAGMAPDGVPFFENAMGMPSGVVNATDVQTPNTREREINALREMWASFLKDPTTGLRPDGTEMPRPEFPISATAGGNNGATSTAGNHPSMHLHRRSSSYGGTTKGMGLSVLKSPPLPHMPTAQQTLQGGANVVQKLEEKASGISSNAQETNMNQQTHIAQVAQGENLKSYEEAVLARKAPVLKLPAKLKTKDSSSSTGSGSSLSTTGGSLLPSLTSSSILPPLPSSSGTSSILPSIASSRSGTATLGGSVGSLFQNQQALPTAAGASAVPVGSTPLQAHLSGQYHPLTQQALAQQQASMADRPMIAMPRPRSRSRPSTASGAPTRPTSAVASAGPNGAQQGVSTNSQPPSRPGTASSNGGAGLAGTHASPPHPQAQSQPNSRPSTSHAHYVGHSAVSPSHTFAFMPPPPNHAPPMPGQAFQPGSLPNESSMAAAMAAAGGSATGPIVVPESPVTGNRPSYKRLASQHLEPASTKRPHIRRGDTNFNPTVTSPGNASNGNANSAMEEDGFESEGSVGGSERSFGHYQRHPRPYPLGMKSPTMEIMPPVSGSGYPGHGFNGSGLGMMSPAGMRRMSEPAVAAPRMAMRLPPAAAQVSVGPPSGGSNNTSV